MLIEVKDNYFMNTKNISFIKFKENNNLEFTYLGSSYLEEVGISDKVKERLYDFFEHDESFVEIPNNQDTKQYINVGTVTKILIIDEDDYIDLKFYFVNDDSPLNKIMQENKGNNLSLKGAYLNYASTNAITNAVTKFINKLF